MSDRQQLSDMVKQHIFPSEPVQHIDNDAPMILGDVPLDILRHFDIDHRTIVEGDKEKLNQIYHWASEDIFEPTAGKIMEAIADIQMRLGGDRSFTKVWNWLKTKQSIKDMRRKQRAMEQGYGYIRTA